VSDVTIAALAKAFGAVAVLQGIELQVPSGGFTAILGPSGCGKTTLLRLIAGFERPDAGTIHLGGQLVCDAARTLPPEQRRIGYVAQEGALFPHLDVAANVTFGLPFRARRDRRRVAELLDLVGLDPDHARRYPHELSGGQQQRVALARALAPQPRVILLDEPFSALDAGLREETRRAVAGALQSVGATAILVTHDQAEAFSLATQLAVMRDGRLAQVGTPADLYAAPVDLAVAAFLGDAVVLPAVIRDGVATCALGSLPVAGPAPAGPAQILIRPEQIDAVPADGAPGLAALVLDSTYYGKDRTLQLRLRDSGTTIAARIPGHVPLTIGQTVIVRVCGEVRAYPA